MQTPKEIVYNTLEFKHSGRIPRQMWVLPWAQQNYPKQLSRLEQDFPPDIIGSPAFLKEGFKLSKGDMYALGQATDEWGCVFTNLHEGIIGEVKDPLVQDEDWLDASNVHIPTEALSVDTQEVNRFCAKNSDYFISAGCCPRPFERLQFIRGTEQLYIDLIMQPPKMLEFIKRMHDFYCKEMLLWAKTDVDQLGFMDDWGAQRSLLINPELWVELFKPMYKDYIDIAHSHGKKVFMHSDGYITDIYPHLIELGLDAINSQLFCMNFEDLKKFAGKITFWGEMDRQHLLPNGTTEEIKDAAQKVKSMLYKNGGIIAQCEFGPGAKPENVYAYFEAMQNM